MRPSQLWAELPSQHLLAARSGRFKWILHEDAPDATEVYDLAHDPGESRNLTGKLIRDPKMLADLHRLVCSSVPPPQALPPLPGVPAPAAPALAPAVRDKLRALGYVE